MANLLQSRVRLVWRHMHAQTARRGTASMTTPTPRSGIPDAWRAILAQKVRAAVHFNNKVSSAMRSSANWRTPQQDRNAPVQKPVPMLYSSRWAGQLTGAFTLNFRIQTLDSQSDFSCSIAQARTSPCCRCRRCEAAPAPRSSFASTGSSTCRARCLSRAM